MGLGVHFSAFSNLPFLWGPNRAPRNAPGYFQRLKMLGTDTSHNWLFICEEFGAEGDGTYYTGEGGDFFVERAVHQILESVWAETGLDANSTVMIGSSAGATGALKFGLQTGAKGIVAISPHVDLDICAAKQGRMEHVAFLCPDGNPLAESNWPYTRQITNLVDTRLAAGDALPHLFVQTCADDDGVYEEQVLPLVMKWVGGGSVELDVRPEGGHTSDWATRPLILDAVSSLFDGRPCDVNAYNTQQRFAGARTGQPLWLTMRYRFGDVERWIRKRLG